jgi:hypothetical protein
MRHSLTVTLDTTSDREDLPGKVVWLLEQMKYTARINGIEMKILAIPQEELEKTVSAEEKHRHSGELGGIIMFKTSEDQKTHLHLIANRMRQEGLSEDFVRQAIEVGEIYEGVYDLFTIWGEEFSPYKKQETIDDIRRMIKEYRKDQGVE